MRGREFGHIFFSSFSERVQDTHCVQSLRTQQDCIQHDDVLAGVRPHDTRGWAVKEGNML